MINETTLPHALPEAMQFGGAFWRLCCLTHNANRRFGPVRAAKCDVKDGYHRMFLNALQCLRLAILLPKFEGEEQLIAVPLAITMGWVQSPPTFCVMSEMVCYVTNAAFNKATFAGTKHRLESMAVGVRPIRDRVIGFADGNR